MYAISTIPLIHRLAKDTIKQVWYADDATASGGLCYLRQWWDHLSEIGPDYGYYPNASKTCLIVKEEKLTLAASLFQGTGVSVAKDGKRHLGAALGTDSFVKTYVCEKVATWVQEVERLSSIAVSQPQSAFAAFTHGLTSKWTYLIRTIPDISNLLQPLEDAIRLHFLPKLTGQNPFNDTVRDLMALPARLGGLGITNPSTQHRTSIEPPLQPLSDEHLEYRTANREDGARLDVMAQGFWASDRQCAFFDVRVFNPFAHFHRNHSLTSCYRRHEQEKRRAYDQRVREIEHGCFSPLVFSTSGGMGPTDKVVYKKLASMIAVKHNQPYSHTLNWLRCRLGYSLLRSAIMCLRGSRSVSRPASPIMSEAVVDRALSDGRVAHSS